MIGNIYENGMKLDFFQKTAVTTVAATVLLILVGGLVRASGAGLGCPDWPQCFGMWIPPTSAADLPAEYDAALFNATHTWLEYINRLIGVLIGLLITTTFIASFKYRKKDLRIVVFSGLAFFLVLFQGWLGGQVVRSGLQAGMITIHMILAMFILSILLYATFRAMRHKISFSLMPDTKRTFLWVIGAIFLLTMIQLVLGTQVRESVDVAKNILELPRSEWIDSLGGLYTVHRSFSWLVVIFTGLLLFYNRKLQAPRFLHRLAVLIATLVFMQIMIGIGMERLAMAGVFQVLHLVSVAILICAELLYWFTTLYANRGSSEVFLR